MLVYVIGTRVFVVGMRLEDGVLSYNREALARAEAFGRGRLESPHFFTVCPD